MQFAELVLTSRTEGLRRGKQDLVDLRNEGARTEQSLTGSTSKMSKGFDGVMSSAKGMAMQLAAAAGAVVTVQKAFGAAEQYTTMQNRLVALGASHEAAASQLQQLADISMGTRAPLEATAELYSRLSLTANSLGASQEELMQFTEAVGLALAASGTSAGQASGALTQLSQAMAGGVVRAEEFNSMIEGAPGLLMAVANGIDGVNGDLGALRQLMLDGELTSEQFFNALLSQTDALQTAFDTTTPTISQALTVLNDQFTLFIGSADQATGVTSAIAEAMLLLAENMDVAVPVFGAVAIGVAAISAPILAAGVAIGGLAVAVITHWDEIKAAFKAGVDYVVGLGPRLVQALKDAGRMALDAALNIGVEIINGISAGIDRKFQDLKDKITGLGVYLPEWLKDMLGIASPSKVFAEIGEWTVEGLIVGMDDREDALRTRAEILGATMGEGIKDGLDPVLRTVFDGLARGDLGSIGSGLLGMAQQGFSNLLQTSFTAGGGGLRNVWQGITGAFTGIGDAYRGAGGGIGGIGAAISSMLPGIGAISSIVGVVQSVIGTTTKLTNALEGTLGIGGLLRGTEYDIKQRDNIFGSKTEKNAEEIFGSWAKYIAQDLDQEFRDMVQNTRDGIRALGLDINEAFTYDFDVQFDESLPHEQLMERLRQELNNANDELLRTSLAAAGLARDGESGAQTLFILNDSLRTANASLRLLDQSLFDVSAIGAGAARELIEIAGGMDAFANKTAFVFDNFLTTAEQDARALAIANENLSQTFDQLAGISIPETHAQFMALLDAQDLTTAAGRETYAALIDVADEFVTVNGTAQEAAEVIGDDLTPALEASTDAARELAAQQREQESLLLQIARMTGNVAYIREQELAALNEANRPLQEYIYLLEDQAAALEATGAALRKALTDAETALSRAEQDLSAARSYEADAIRALDDAYADLDRATQSRIDTLQSEIRGYEDLIASAESALIALGAMSDVKTPLEQAQDAAAAFEAGISDLASAIDRERSAIQSNISNLQSEADALSAALFPENAAQDLIAAMQARDVMSDMLDISRRLNDKARDILRLNENIVEVQRQTALAELQAMLARGQIDQAGLDRLMEEAGTFNPDQFQTFEQMSFEQKKTVNVLNDLADLQDDLAREAQREEDARAAAARETALAQLDALLDQIAVEQDALEALGDLEKQWGLVEDQLSAAEIAANLPALKAAAEGAKADAIAFYKDQIQDNEHLIREAERQAGILEGIRAEHGLIDDAILTVGQAIENLVAAQSDVEGAINSVSEAIRNLNSAQDAVGAAQDAVDQATGGGGVSGGGDITDGMSSAEKRLMGILDDLTGGQGAAMLGADAFGYFSEDNMNAILTDAGVSALSGLAADVAGVFRDTLGRNVDVAGLEYYIGQIEDNGLTLDQISTDIGGSVEALTKLIPGFATSVSEAIYGINLAANTAVGAATTAVNAAQDAAASAAAAANAASTPVLTGGMYDTIVDAATGQTYGEYLAGVPSYATGTKNHPGGWARLHENEMVNLPKGTGVSTAAEVSQAAEERRKSNDLLSELAARVRDQQVEAKRMRKILSKWDTIGQPGTAEGQTVTTEAAT